MSAGQFYDCGELEGEWVGRARERVGEPEGEEAAARVARLRTLILEAFGDNVLPQDVLTEANLKR